ncbi:MAG: lytic transglycosylase domain-containing protein [Gemmatimonadetes bacterium]|nr:lytic transglycosylase domain-containing protein [Gemmatimonadota bacterium]
MSSRARANPTRLAAQEVSDVVALLRLTLTVLCSAMLVSTVPPLRGVMGVLRHTVLAAIEVSRSTDASRVAIARYALRYGIPYEFAATIQRIAEEEGVDPELAFRLVQVESRFHDRAVSPVGARGLTQLMPRTAESLKPGITPEEIFDRETNLRLGFRYLHGLLDRYDGRVPEALHAYNRGPGTVSRIRSAGGDPANGYADRVLGTGGPEAYGGSGFLSSARAPRGLAPSRVSPPSD